MLKVLNLFVIDKIFTEKCSVKISSLAKSLYVNCLIYYFKDKKPSVVNIGSFKLYKAEIPKYENFDTLFLELQLAKLIRIEELEVIFLNVWSEYIEKNCIKQLNPTVYVGAFSRQNIAVFEKQFREAHKFHLLVQQKYSINEKKCNMLIDLFYQEQLALSKDYKDIEDCLKHFMYWTQHNLATSKANEVPKVGEQMYKKFKNL